MSSASVKRQKLNHPNDTPCLMILPQKIQKRRLEILLNGSKKKCFHIAERFGPEITHVVTEITDPVLVEKALKLETGGLAAADVTVVATDWLSRCIKEGRILPVDDKDRVDLEKQDVVSQDEEDAGFAGFACQRRTPLHHHNTTFTRTLEILEMNADFRDEYSRSLAFRRGACVLKSWPCRVVNLKEIQHVKNMGSHCLKVIKEILENDCCHEADEIENSSWFKKMKLFTGIFGVGRSTAEKWVSADISCLEEVKKSEDCARRNDPKVKIGLEYYEDLALPVLRQEADAIQSMIQKEAEIVLPGATVELTGGFRRGKESGHDVDLLLSHPEEGKEPGLLARLLSRLHNMGLVLYGNHENSTFTESVLRTDSKLHGLKGQLDHFEKWIGVLKVDKSFRKKDNDCCEVSTSNEGHFSSRETSWKAKNEEFSWNARRVDLIVVPHSQYYYALVGWIGSKHFNRSLRLYAQRELNMKLSSHGLYDNNTGKTLEAASEKEVFSNLKLEYREPCDRNC